MDGNRGRGRRSDKPRARRSEAERVTPGAADPGAARHLDGILSSPYRFLTGWAAARAGDTDLAGRALDLLDRKWGQVAVDPAERLPRIGSVPTPFPREDPRNHFTNATSQWALSVIALLELVPEAVEAAYASRSGLPPTDG